LNKFNRFAALWGPVIAWCGVIFYLSHIPNLRITREWWDFPLRKAAHMVEYGILARLLARAFAGSTSWSRKKIFAVSLALAILYAASDEAHQLFVPGRHGTPRDVLIDSAGAWLALGIKP
jgi:VanZ family protein